MAAAPLPHRRWPDSNLPRLRIMYTYFSNFIVTSHSDLSLKLSDFHWECYEAIRSEQLASFLKKAVGNFEKQFRACKTLIELESLGLITNQSKVRSYDAWRKGEEVSQNLENEISVAPAEQQQSNSLSPAFADVSKQTSSNEECIEVQERVNANKSEVVSVEF